LGPLLSISEETLRNELQHAAKLDGKHRGELAELAFMRKAAALGFAVAKPWGDCDRYDVIIRTGKIFWRVQIKSVWGIASSRHHYRVTTTGNHKHLYSADEIDFLVAYIFPEDAWYVFPVAVLGNRKILCIRTGYERSCFQPYREAWKLMRPAEPETAIVEPAAVPTAAADFGSAP
jgi:PD-(D/E)XK endonuclease